MKHGYNMKSQKSGEEYARTFIGEDQTRSLEYQLSPQPLSYGCIQTHIKVFKISKNEQIRCLQIS